MDELKMTEDIIKALDNSSKALPSEDFKTRMEGFALAYSTKMNSFSKQMIMGFAASFLLLIAANIYVVNKFSSQSVTSSLEATIESYNLVPAKSIY